MIYGVPTRTDSGATPITITATNPDGTTTASTFSFRVDDPHHSVSYPVRVIAGLNEPVDVYHHGKGNSGPTSYSLVCGTMPDGLRLDPKTGVISGTPTIQVQYPIPLRIRQVDDHGWVDSSMMLLVGGTTNPWLTYQHHVTVAKGTTRTIRPTVVGLPAATYELVGNLPRGMTLDPATGAITGRPAAVSKKPAKVSVLAMLPDGTVAASDTLLITVRKRAIPMAVNAAPARTVLRDGQVATVVSKVKHTRASKLTAKVMCAGCTHTFNKATGTVTVRPGTKTTTVKVTITADPVGKANKAKYRHHVWSRSWKVTR
ncbi:MAG: putative Ig domain-containing protein [Candidatus Nanopelagicales bacterium]